MKRNITLFITILKRNWLEMIRYPFNMISEFTTIYIIFLIIFLGLKHYIETPSTFGNTIDGIVVGFLLWIWAIDGFWLLTWSLIEEARIGTLEQLYMTQLGFGKLCIFKMVANFLLSIVYIIPILVLMMATTGRWLHIDLLSLTPLFIFTLASAQGIGFICGGLGLIFKQIQAFFQILQFIFIAFIVAPADKISLLKILPMSLGTRLISRIMVNELSIIQLPKIDLFLLILNGSVYFIIGFFIFRICERIARQRALLGHY